MLTPTPITGNRGVASYFARDNYYSREEGLGNSEWFGAAAACLELEGPVDSKVLAQLADGEVARDGVLVGRVFGGKRHHRLGWDLTFGAPKSASILAEVYGYQEVRAAHLEAVKEALSFIQSHLLTTRLHHDGQTRRFNTDNAIFALFTHDVSRELDPHLHTHCLLLNLTNTPRGWRSISSERLFKHMRLASQIYKHHLERRLRTLGYTPQPHVRDPTLFELDEVPERYIRLFSKRSAQIEAYFDERGLTYDSAKAKIVALKTRKKKVIVPREELCRRWLLEAGGFQPDRHRTINPHLLPVGAEASGLAERAVDHAINHLSEKESAFTRQDLIREALKFGKNLHSAKVYEAIERRIQRGQLVLAPDHPDADRRDSPLWTTPRAIAIEKALSEHLVARCRGFGPMVKAARLDRWLGRTKLNAQQRAAVRAALTSTGRFFAIQGDPGTGKTTLLKVYRDFLAKQGYRTVALAPSHETVAVLSDELKIQGFTVDRYLVDPAVRSKHWGRQAVWIVDEASMLSTEKLTELMEPLELGWKKRSKAETALMEHLVPQLKKLAQGREISGLAAYE